MESHDAKEACEMVRQFESADTESKQKEAINKVEAFLATSDKGDLVFDAIIVLRQMCVKKNLGQKFNDWRKSFMQRKERENPTEEELCHLPYKTKPELMEWLQNYLDCEAPAITDEEVMSEAMGGLFSKNIAASNVCIVCYNDPTKDEEQPDNPEILVCDTPYEDSNYVRNAGHGMCTDCHELYRFRYGNGACPLCRMPWTKNISNYPQRLRDRIEGGDHVVTAENIKSKLRGNGRDYDLAAYLISLIQPGFDFYIAGGESLFFYVILEKNADIFDKLLSKAEQTNNSHLFLEANVRSGQYEEFGLMCTALQWACACGWPYAIQQLVSNHADPNFYLGHCPPLHVALQFQHETSAEMVCLMGARVDMVDEYGLGPLFYFSPNIMSNAYWNWMEGPEDEDNLTEPGKSMARQRAMSTLAFEIDTSLKLLSEMCRKGADVNQFGVFPKKEAQRFSTQENLESWRQSATTVTPLFAILANQHDVHGSNNNGRRFGDEPELQAECWEALGNWMVEVTKIFARSGCDIYGRIHGGETILYWVERWSEESQIAPCKLAYAKVLQHLRSGAYGVEALRPWLQMLPLQPR